MAESREMEGCGPAEIAVAAEHQNVHLDPFLDDDHDFPRTVAASDLHILGCKSGCTLSGH
jgi:hypothetical protein